MTDPPQADDSDVPGAAPGGFPVWAAFLMTFALATVLFVLATPLLGLPGSISSPASVLGAMAILAKIKGRLSRR